MTKKLTIYQQYLKNLEEESKYRFIQIHMLTPLGAHNINRDEHGLPKTLKLNGTMRGRRSSQCFKRPLGVILRKTDYATGHLTPFVGRLAFEKLVNGGIEEETAKKYAFSIIDAFGKRKEEEEEVEEENGKSDKKTGKKKDPLKMEAVKIQQIELDAVDTLVKKIVEGYTPQPEDFTFLKRNISVDMALFGRMLASHPEFDVKAAVSVNHAFTVNNIENLQEDYLVAIDSLQGDDVKGSAHMDKFFFSTGVFYTYVTIDREQLLKSIGGNKDLSAEKRKGLEELTNEVVQDLTEIIITTTAEACKNRCADGVAQPGYIMIERGFRSPRSLSLAFHKPVEGDDVLPTAIKLLLKFKTNSDNCYYHQDFKELNMTEGVGNIEELRTFVTGE